MNTEQQLIQKWRSLSQAKQQQVLQFVESLNDSPQPASSELGQRLRQIRAKIVASGEPLLSEQELIQEVTDRRGGLPAQNQ